MAALVHHLPMPESSYRSQVIRVADLAVTSHLIAGVTFQDCLILGPAILGLQGSGTLSHCIFEGGPEQMFWEVPEGSFRIGAIGLIDCHFVGCRFEGIGFAAPRGVIDEFLRGLS